MVSLDQKLIVVACFFQQAFAIGTLVNLGMFTDYFLDEFQVTNAQVSLIMSLSVSSLFGAGLFSFTVMKKFGCRKSCVISAIIASLSLILASYLDNFVLIVIVLGPMAGLSGCFQFMAYNLVIPDIFQSHHERTVFYGFANAGVGFGSMIMPLVFAYFLSEYTWRQALFITGAILFNLVPASMLLPKELKTYEEEKKEKDSAKSFTVFTNIYFVFTIAGCFSLQAFTCSAFYTFMSPLLLEQGLRVSNIGVAFMLFGIASIPGRLGIPYLANLSKSPITCWCLVCILLSLCQTVLLFCSHIWWMTIVVSCGIGLCYGGSIVYCAVISDKIRNDSIHLAYSLISLGFGFAGLLGPIIVGVLVDILGNYQYPLLIGYIINVLFFVVFAVWDRVRLCRSRTVHEVESNII